MPLSKNMKFKIFYFLLVILSTVLPVLILRDSMTAVAFFVTMVAIFGAGRAFHSLLFPSRHVEFNSFGIGFILLTGASFATAMLELNALYFTLIYIVSACYGLYWLLNYFRKDTSEQQVNWILVVICLLVLGLNVYPTLLIQGYSHDSVFSWVNNDAAGYTSIANQVKLGIYPVTIPGFGIEKLYYHYGAYAFGGLIANVFHLPASGSLFGIVRPLAVISVMFSLISIGATTLNKPMRSYRIAGALTGFFLIGSLTSVFEYLPFHFSRIDHGMKHLRGFLIGHSSLWIFTALVPVIALLNEKVIRENKINFIQFVLFFLLISCSGSLNFVAAAICFFLLLFFVLLFRNAQTGNSFILKRNLVIISLPLVLLLAGVSAYLHVSQKNIETSIFFLPIFNLATWSNFLMIFFLLYIGIRLSGLNYLSSKTEVHFGYIQFIVVMAALCLMVLIGFFVEPKGGRENDIKYGYVIIEGVLGMFSGIWLAERMGNLWVSAEKNILIRLRNLVNPLLIIFSILFVIALAGFINSKSAPALVSPYLKSVAIPVLALLALIFILRFKKSVLINKQLIFSFIAVSVLISLPGCLHEFNKYRTIKDNDETFQVNSSDIKIVNKLNELNKEHKLVFVSVEDLHADDFGKAYTFSSLTNAPVLNEASKYFGVFHKKSYQQMEQTLDSFYTSNNVGILKNIADKYAVSFFVFNKKLVNPALFDSTGEFKFQSDKTDSIYILKYLKAK